MSSKRTFERCAWLVLMALSNPGQYLLGMRQKQDGLRQNYIGCKLTRRVP